MPRKTLDQFEALLCIVHLINADAVPFAITVAIQALLALLEAPQPVEDDWGFSRMWPSGDALSSVDVDLQLTLRAVQIALLAKQGRDVLPMVQIADQLITRAGASSWGAAFVSSTLAIHLLRVQPILANKYLLGALNSFPRARLPNGLPLPASPHPLEDILWATAIACKSDADVDSWLTTISQLTPAQLQTIKKSQLAPDNVTVLCDGIWLRVYLKPEAERDWDPVETKIEEIEATARAIGFPLLEAAALRTRIMLLMEWRHRIEAGLQLSESSLIRFDSDDCRFLITEVTGRQLSYAGRPAEARGWLERALSCDAYRHSLWRRNVLITMAELESASTPNRAVEFTAAALKVSREGNLADPIYIDSLAEHGIALWNSGDRRGSFEMFEEATNRVLATKVDSDAWKGEFARLFGVIVYFSAVALNGEPQHGHYEPKQGLFLASNTHAHTAYKPEQLAYICIRLAMFADGIQDVSKSASWTWRAIEAAQNAPTASEAVGMQSWHAIPAALLSDDFVCAAKLVGVITEVDIDKVVGRANGARQIDTSAGMTTQGTISLPTSARKSLLHLSLIVPIGLRLGFLQFRGADIEVITGALKEIESIVPVELQVEAFTKEIARALLHDCDWQALWNDSCEAYRQHQYVRGCVLSIGSMKNAPLSQSLYMQVSIAQNMAGFFNRCASIYREIVAPFFVAYWQRAVNESSATFRTAATFTQRQLKEADGSPEGTRRLLKAMRFCLGVKLPEDAMRWLDS